MKLFSLIIIFVLFNSNSGLKILGIVPLGSKSHFAIGHGIVKTLHDAGHEVTMISPFPQKKPPSNYKDVDISDLLTMRDDQEVNPFEIGKMPVPLMIGFLYKMGIELVDFVMQHEEVQKLMNSNEKFDICVVEIFNIDAILGIAEHVDCKLISYTTFGAVLWTDDMTGNISPSSYVPQPFLKYTDKMNFCERLWNTCIALIESFLYHAYHMPSQRSLYKKYFPNAKRSFDEMYKGSSIIFHNSHVSSSTVRPSLPSVIDIAGIHVKSAQKLPDDIQEFLDSATDGVILFSMGSFIQSQKFPVEKREAFVNVFGKLKQKVIWKYENETLPNNPGNIKIGSWIPQRDILAHPNVKIFITHGGLLGTTEAVVEGVPVLGLPIFGDQKMNMAKSVMRGYGLQVDYDEINEENIGYALNELLNNPKYRENAQRISKIFNDRPMTPQESVLYWTEYVVRHDGAEHLRAEGRNLNFIEFHMIDVYLVLGLIAIVFLYIDYLILRMILRKIFSKKNLKEKKQ